MFPRQQARCENELRSIFSLSLSCAKRRGSRRHSESYHQKERKQHHTNSGRKRSKGDSTDSHLKHDLKYKHRNLFHNSKSFHLSTKKKKENTLLLPHLSHSKETYLHNKKYLATPRVYRNQRLWQEALTKGAPLQQRTGTFSWCWR